jgi:hypothetical protein
MAWKCKNIHSTYSVSKVLHDLSPDISGNFRFIRNGICQPTDLCIGTEPQKGETRVSPFKIQ